MSGTFQCGHERTEANTKVNASRGSVQCRACHNARTYEWKKRNRDSATEYVQSRIRRLPDMLDATRRKLAGLENEARRYGMLHLLEPAE